MYTRWVEQWRWILLEITDTLAIWHRLHQHNYVIPSKLKLAGLLSPIFTFCHYDVLLLGRVSRVGTLMLIFRFESVPACELNRNLIYPEAQKWWTSHWPTKITWCMHCIQVDANVNGRKQCTRLDFWNTIGMQNVPATLDAKLSSRLGAWDNCFTAT